MIPNGSTNDDRGRNNNSSNNASIGRTFANKSLIYLGPILRVMHQGEVMLGQFILHLFAFEVFRGLEYHSVN